MHEGGVVRRDVDIQHANPFIFEDLMMSGLPTYLYLRPTVHRRQKDYKKEKQPFEHSLIYRIYRFIH